ncbi:Ankyrin repeat-containing domain-containing protein [Aspergillus oryzae]|uniref:Ankyrin repeat-containing domain-containing protein n=1 Tax=Aspergillus oryzae TaxID=5062 RepID=A0A1S9D538_ASPOZ|nr:Ankyrin repeat-containing domain-containing protein [Aspergillus oryzae]
MSDVDAVSSLPAALDAGHSALAVKVNHRSPSGPRSPKRSSPFPVYRREDDRAKEVNPVAGAGEGPPSPKADSEAETIIQSGRESLSPEKRRKYIQHEPKRRDDDDHVDAVESDLPPNDLQVRKRKLTDSDSSDGRDRVPRLLSPKKRIGSPPSIVKVEKPEDVQSLSSRPELSTTSVPRTSRKRSFSETIDGEGDAGRPARLRDPAVSRERERKDLSSVTFPRPVSTDRSASPVRSVHKRTASGPQLGDMQRKKKAPTPLVTGYARQSSEDRQSVSSSTSGSPLPSAHLRKLGSVDGASASPARPTGHKKQRDQNGRTRLARACAAQELETAMARHAERPEDLNVADNAGNTPLQIASLEGCAPIVKFLLDSGCEIDTKNIDKDTPLIDAVENGHLDVVKLLLAAGANPRLVNAEGDEPYDLVPSDSEDYEEIRRVLAQAKANPRPSRRSEERAGSENKETSSRRVSAESARESPPVNRQRSPPFATTKRKTVRSEATRNDLLWTTATPENLQAFAAKGDIVGVANILNVGQKADPESMIAAAKGGHDEVISLLLGMGDADPDPDPVQGGSQKPGYNTPMLAAIGRGNLAVIRILLNQPEFNPTRRLHRDRTYFELSRERRAENWEDEYDLLRDAYDNHVRTKKSRKQDLHSPRRARDKDKENKRPGRRDSPSPGGRPRKTNGSPGYRDPASKDTALTKEKRRDNVAHLKEKSNPARPKPAHPTGTDPDSARPDPRPKQLLPPREGESSRGEEAPKRRRLIAGRPPQDRRRPSLPSSDSLSSRDESSKARIDHLEPSKSGPPPLKRGRSSASPERGRALEPERHSRDTVQKKRRVLSEDGTPNITNGGLKKDHTTGDAKPRRKDDEDHHAESRPDPLRQTDNPSHKAPERKPVKEEQERHDINGLNDIPMDDYTERAEAEAEARRQKEARKARQERLAEEARLAAEAEKARLDKEEEERAAHAARLAQEKEKAAEEERKRKEAEQRRIKQAEDERQKRLEQERLRLAKVRREQEELEQRRRDALPSRLRIAANLVGSNDPQAKSHLWLKKFMPVVTAETRQLDPSCAPDVAVEKWVPNYLVAPLLATNDLQLAQYSSWEKRDATPTQRMNLWRVTRRMLVQADDADFMNSSFGQVMQKDSEARPKYFDMEHVFWVKLSDFMDLVPHIPHLHGLDLQFLKMHIDQEPTAPLAFSFPQANGHISGPSHVEDTAGLPNGVQGLTNGYGHRPSTYV